MAAAEPGHVHQGFGNVGLAVPGGLAGSVLGGVRLGVVVSSHVAQVGLRGVGHPALQVGLVGGGGFLHRCTVGQVSAVSRTG